MCKFCGFTSEDLAVCVRCRRKIPDDVKILDDPSYKPKPDSTELMGTKKLRLHRIPGKRSRRPGNPDEPVCIALSSDEEGGEDDENSRTSNHEGNAADQQSRRVGVEEQGDDGVVVEERITDGTSGPWCSLPCRSIRIGNYKVLPKDKLMVTPRGIQFKVPGILPPQEVITISIGMNDILKVLAHFGKSMPLLFLYVSQDACARVRRQLKMVNTQSFYLEVQSPDETQKRITILPEKLTEENKAVLKQHFESKLQELESKDANEILVRSSPKDIAMLKAKMMGAHNQAGGSKSTAQVEQAVVKYCQYPPDSPGNVSITNEDYNCLEAEQFLNDVIIDFYLKYIQMELFGTVDQWSKRTHIFTTYFYKRLTTRPPNSKTKAHPVEDNPNLSAAEKRYERVKKWTKKVNIFDKDFIVVPINEHAHWFVCVICFPGQEGCVRADDGTACEPVASNKTTGIKKKKRVVKKPTMQIGATTIIPLSGRDDVAIRYNVEEDSDRDEAEASDDDMEDEEGEGGESRKPGEEGEGETPPAVRRPCILIFDSLKGGSKARTCQTLRDYLSCEWKAKMVPSGKEEKKFDNALMPGSQPTVQQQPNFSDCGIYLLQYIQSFFRDPISDYNFPIRSVRQWFSKEEVEGKRGNIAELIRKLTGEQNPDKEFNFPQLNFLNPEIEGEESEEDEEEEDEGNQQPPTSAAVSNGVVRLTAASATSSAPGRLLVTPAKQQGKVLIQKTGTFNPTQLAALTAVPPGVTVTPARTLATNISVRKTSQPVSSSRPTPSASSSSTLVTMGDTIQTSPDSTSHEDSYGEGPTAGRSEGEGQGENNSLPDSQGFESGKRSAETPGPDEEAARVKRTKSEEDSAAS